MIIRTKYRIGQKVWYKVLDIPMQFRIVGIKFTQTENGFKCCEYICEDVLTGTTIGIFEKYIYKTMKECVNALKQTNTSSRKA